MKYIQTDIEAEEEMLEPLTGFLLNHGITGTAVEDPADLELILNKEEDYEWDYISEKVMSMRDSRPRITFYLEDSGENRLLAAKIAEEAGQMFPGTDIRITWEDDSLWKDKWKEYFKPARITDRLTVKPTWEEYHPQEDELVIEIDPGMAFGTGTHETTSLCLKLMEVCLLKEGRSSGREKVRDPGKGCAQDHDRFTEKTDRPSVLDVGCGSGILSIGAALLGAEEILAIDIDPEAVRVTEENVRLNHVEKLVRVRQGNLVDGIDFKADLIVANLMADLVMELSAHVAGHLSLGGVFISSGILVEKAEEVAAAIRKAGFDIDEIRKDGMWCAIIAHLRQGSEK